ncbi:histidine phosphatase family protein [Pelotomaculum propionicicum]|uniref:histidine phosphatase family protein n=1 Tax=Pelotomaculum propionicicum TaxID=258475 RepID=UPI00249E4758|nr:histidine phosphatase family protein [Pelotomaculum propionicicum]
MSLKRFANLSASLRKARKDLPLSETGRAQAARLRDELARLRFSRIFCSDLKVFVPRTSFKKEVC